MDQKEVAIMKNRFLKSIVAIAIFTMVVGLLGCKDLDSDSNSSKVSIDISGLLANLPVSSSSSSSSQSSDGSNQISSPTESDAQTAVETLLVIPMTYSKHGKPYSTDTFDEATKNDFEDDAANSVNFLQYIQLPSSSSTVELEVPSISDGWQLVAAATKTKVTSVDDIEGATIVYLGITDSSFKSADDFNKANISLTLQRNCDQDADKRPKGCAAFDGDQKAIVTSAVEITRVTINGVEKTGTGNPGYPWIVRDSGGTLPATAATQLEKIVTDYKAANPSTTISNITVYVTHQKTDGKSVACQNASAVLTLQTECGEQAYSRPY